MRERNIRRSIHNFRLLSQALGAKDDDLAALVDSSNRVFTAFANQDANLRASLQELPGALQATNTTLAKVDELGNVLGPTLGALRPGARALGPALVQTRPFLKQTTPIIQNQLRPFARAALPVAKVLRPAAQRPRRRHAQADHLGQGPQLPAQRAGLQPAGQGGGLPVLGVVGQPRRRDRLLHPGRARPDPPRPGAGLVLDAAGAPTSSAARSRSSARSARCSTRPTRRRVPDDEPGRRGARRSRRRRRCPTPSGAGEEPLDAEAGSQPRSHPGHGGFALSCFGLLLFLWLAFGGPIPLQPKGYRFNVAFKEAGTLSPEADVRISGVSVGKVKVIHADKQTGASDATIQLDTAYAPIPKDTKAILRQKTLLGETYVELTPGSKSAGHDPRERPPARRRGSPTVELDEIFRAFDPKTREAFQTWMQQLALAVAGPRARHLRRAGQPGAVRRGHDDAAEDPQRPARRRAGRGPRHRRGLRRASERDGQLRSLIDNSNRVFATTAARNRELERPSARCRPSSASRRRRSRA